MSRRWAALVILLAATGLVAAQPSAAAQPIAITAEPIPLNPRQAGQSRVGALDFLAGFVLSARSPDWGGWSGMVLSPDGRTLTAISDLGQWLRLELRQDPSGRLLGIGAATMQPVRNLQGHPLLDKRWADGEALARDGDGSLLVAFERHHRIWRYAADAAARARPAAPVNAPAAIRQLPANTGIEAMAVLDQGRILLISEAGLPGEPDIAAWLGHPGAWARLTLARSGPLTVSDATLLPDGDLLLIERHFSMLGAADVRLSVVPRASIRPGGRLVGRTLAELGPPLSIDNFEAAAARPGPAGSTLIYLLSDDNQSFLQRTLLLQFRLDPAAPAVAGSP